MRFYGYRFYLAEMGRWINRDPIGEVGGSNLYGFTDNDSMNKYDLLGHEFLGCCGGTPMYSYGYVKEECCGGAADGEVYLTSKQCCVDGKVYPFKTWAGCQGLSLTECTAACVDQLEKAGIADAAGGIGSSGGLIIGAMIGGPAGAEIGSAIGEIVGTVSPAAGCYTACSWKICCD